MRRLLPLLLIFCLLLTSCVKIEGGAKDTGNPGGAQGGNAAEAGNEAGAAHEGAPVEPFTLYPAFLQLPMGQHLTLDADTAPPGKKLTWTSSDPSVATVDESGCVTPVAVGEAVITAALADDAGISSTCGVLVAAEGNVFLWEYPLEREDIDALRAQLNAAQEQAEE